MPTVGTTWIQSVAWRLDRLLDAASLELQGMPSSWLIGAVGLVALPLATFALQQIVGSIIAGETWRLWRRIVRPPSDAGTAIMPSPDLQNLILEQSRTTTVIKALDAQNQYLLALTLGKSGRLPIRGAPIVGMVRRARPFDLARGRPTRR